jgi:hypothetical protein
MHFNRTLCSKAWTDVNISFSKQELRHCCKANHEKFPENITPNFFNNSPGIVKRRQDLLSGIENIQCDSCWKSYRETGTAYREHNNKWQTFDDVTDDLEIIEIMLDNLCDMSCIYCTEHSSHRIAQELGLPNRVQTPVEDHYKVFLDWLSTIDYEYVLSFLGGELTYSKNFYKFLNLLIHDTRFNNKKIHLSLMTNGNTLSSQLDKFFSLYDQIPDNWNLIIFFSNEATGELSEIVRWGLDWNTYAENFKKYLTHDRIETIGLCPTPSLFTVSGLEEYLMWAFDIIRSHNKKVLITGNWVDGDTILSPAYSNNTIVPNKIKKLVIQNSDLFVNEKWYNNCLTWTDQLEKILNTKTYTKLELTEFLDTMAYQKKSEKIYKLLNYVT